MNGTYAWTVLVRRRMSIYVGSNTRLGRTRSSLCGAIHIYEARKRKKSGGRREGENYGSQLTCLYCSVIWSWAVDNDH